MAFTNYRGSNRGSYRDTYSGYKQILPVYVLQTNNFKLNQILVSFGAKDVEYFTINGNYFLAVANAYNGMIKKQGSVVYKWEAGKFQKLQSPSIIAADAHFFTINTRKFISFSSPIYGNWASENNRFAINLLQVKF